MTSLDMLPAFLKCWNVHYHILYSPHPPRRGRQWPHLMVWKREASKSSETTSKPSPQSLRTSLRSLLMTMCWGCQSCILGRHSPPGGALQGLEGGTAYSRARHTSAEPPLRVQPPRRGNSHPWAPQQLYSIFSNKWMNKFNRRMKSPGFREVQVEERDTEGSSWEVLTGNHWTRNSEFWTTH